MRQCRRVATKGTTLHVSKPTSDCKQVGTCRICRIAPNLPKISYISSAEMLKGRLRMNSTLRAAVCRCVWTVCMLRMDSVHCHVKAAPHSTKMRHRKCAQLWQ